MDRRCSGLPRAYQPKMLRSRQHQILRLNLLGYSNKDIADKLGVTPATVSNTVNSNLGRLRTQILSAELDHTAVEAAKEIRRLAPIAIRVIEETLTDDTVPAHVRLQAAKDALDRAGLGAAKKVDISSTSVSLSATDLENLKARALERAAANGLVIDVPAQ